MHRVDIVVITAVLAAALQTVGSAQPPDASTPSPAPIPSTEIVDSSVRLPATVYIGAADVDWTGRDPDSASPALGFDLGGALFDRTQLNVSFVRGPADILSALTVGNLYRSTIRASLRTPAWAVTAGELRTTNHLFAGPSLRADGFKLEVRRRLVADLTVARPYYIGRPSGGHVAQGRIGLRVPAGTIALFGSDMARPANNAPVAVVVTTPTDTVTEITDREFESVRPLVARDSRLRGWGAESDLRFRGAHTLVVRAGVLELANQSGQTTRGTAAEMRYGFTRGKLSLNASGRRAPSSVPGVYVQGDALSAGARVPIGGDVIATAQAYSNVNWFFGQAQPLRSTVASAGIQRFTQDHRFSLRYSDKHVTSPVTDLDIVTRTLSGTLSIPLGPLRVDARAERGPAQRGPRATTVEMYGLSLSADMGPHSIWIAGSYDDYGFQRPRARADAGLSAELKGIALEFGAGYGTGQVLGNDVSAWGKVEMPIARGFTLVSQIDYLQWDYGASPYVTLLLSDPAVSPWRITLGIRRKLSIRIPFVRRTHDPSNATVTDDYGPEKNLSLPPGFPPR